MKKVICILTLLCLFVLAGCSPSVPSSIADLEITKEENDVLYSVAPYDQLLPRKVLSGYALVDFYVSRIEGEKSGTVTYLNDKGIKIEVSMFTYKQDVDVIADPENPETYNGLFLAKDLAPKLIEARMETFVPRESFDFKVGVLCDNYRVTYRWYPSEKYPEEQPISAKQIYDMITSSRYFTK